MSNFSGQVKMVDGKVDVLKLNTDSAERLYGVPGWPCKAAWQATSDANRKRD